MKLFSGTLAVHDGPKPFHGLLSATLRAAPRETDCFVRGVRPVFTP